MLPRVWRAAALSVALGALSFLAVACERVPLLAPTGSTITLTPSTTAVSANGSTTIIAQVLEAAGTPPHSGTHVTFNTTLGRIDPAEVSTDANGRVTVTFFANGASGTATITAISGGASTGADGAVKIAVGSAAVGKITVVASPSSLPAAGGTSTIAATAFDSNGNALSGVLVSFTTDAGSLSETAAVTDNQGRAGTKLTTSRDATVTASVGAAATSGTTTAASGTVKVTVSNGPTISISAPSPSPVSQGLPVSFTFTIAPAATNGSPVRDASVNWGDGSSHAIGTATSTQSHVFSSAGTFIVSVSATDTGGNTSTATSSVVVTQLAAPSIGIVATLPFTVNVPIKFDVTVSVPTGLTVTDAKIDYGDGGIDQLGAFTGTATRFHTFTSPGVKVITVYVKDSAGRLIPGSTSILVGP